MPKTQRPNIILHTLPGLEQIAWRELRYRGLDASRPSYYTVPGRNGLVALRYEDELTELPKLQCAEDAYGIVLQSELLPGQSALDVIDKLIPTSVGRLRQLLAQRNTLYSGHARHKQIRFRVISRMVAGHSDHGYTRHALQRHLTDAIEKATRQQWVSVPDGEDVELWCTLIDSDLSVALRLSDEGMRQRAYKIAHLPASLRPSAAAAMALLSQPRDDDVVLDPMCGTGTLLIERAMMGRYRRLVGYDIDGDAVDAARANFGPRHKPRSIELGDATRLPLDDASVTKVISNLPFGVQIAEPRDLPALYDAALREMLRVTAVGGRWVLMTSASDLLKRCANALERVYLIESHRVLVLGQRAEITVWGVA